MKNIYFFFTLLFASGLNSNQAQDTWTKKADFGGGARFSAAGFSIGNKGYIGTGSIYSYNLPKKDFWEYDPATDTWSQKADFGGVARRSAVGFSIGIKGYIGTGYDGSPSKDFWEYDPATNAWMQKADFGKTGRQYAVGFSIASKGYIGTGYDPSLLRNFWEYTPGTSTINSKDSMALVALYNSTDGAKWINNENWLTINPVSTWYGITLSTTNIRVSKIALPNNNLNGNIPSELGKLKSLQYLRLDSNQLNGHIPWSFGKLKSLVVLNIKFNQLRGNIPSSLGDLSNLQHLTLTHNNLKGNIPSSFSNLTNLRWLKLGDNKLSGTVPAFLSTLPNLKRLVLLHNNYTFDGLETLVQNNQLDSFRYARQRAINIHQNNNVLSVYAGGTLSNNTYKWFNNGVLVSTITGDSTYTPTASGNYSVEVTNSIATELTLKSDTVSFNAFEVVTQDNSDAVKVNDKTNFSVYPNPAKSTAIIAFNETGNCIIKLTDVSGRVLQTKTIVGAKGRNTVQLDISKYARGVYLITLTNDKGQSHITKLSKE